VVVSLPADRNSLKRKLIHQEDLHVVKLGSSPNSSISPAGKKRGQLSGEGFYPFLDDFHFRGKNLAGERGEE